MKGGQALVLDTWAVMAYLEGEPAGRKVKDLLANAQDKGVPLLMSVINAGEVWTLFCQEGSAQEADQTLHELGQLGIRFVPADWDLAQAAARLRARHHLSCPDSYAAALAATQSAELVTGDAEFAPVEREIKVRWVNKVR